MAIPRLCVSATSPYQPRVPIASLTKMMTVWVVLHQLPLTYSERGPCVIVSAHDVALWDYDVDSGQSNARIVVGERICEGTLLRGLLVHSAGDYSQLLESIIGWSPATFVRVMNRDAQQMGLTRTHYVDLTGISPLDRSTAGNQATLAVNLMGDEPIVDQIVALTHVALPYNGVVESYTPLIGVANVVGVKSGYTDPAGGCDVMAVKVTIGANTFLTYAVVLGQQGWNALNTAGDAALALSQSLRASIKQVRTASGVQLQWTGPAVDQQR
jgi:D-alanyl-D-alanine carboxypeptidase (penicillin-binding protein 5/6)